MASQTFLANLRSHRNILEDHYYGAFSPKLKGNDYDGPCFPLHNNIFGEFAVIPLQVTTTPGDYVCIVDQMKVDYYHNGLRQQTLARYRSQNFLGLTLVLDDGMLVSDPYTQTPEYCHYFTNTNTWAESECQMPAECGRLFTESSVPTWVGNLVKTCHGVGVADSQLPLNHTKGIVRVYRWHLETPRHEIYSLYNIHEDTVLMHRDDIWYIIPSLVLFNSWVFDARGRITPVDNTSADCNVDIDPVKLHTILRPIPIGKYLVYDYTYKNITVTYPVIFQNLPIASFPFASIDGQTADLQKGDVYPWQAGLFVYGSGRYSSATVYEKPVLISCLTMKRYYRYNIPLFAQLTSAISGYIVLFLNSTLNYIYTGLDFILAFIFELGFIKHLILLCSIYVYTPNLYRALIIFTTILVIQHAVY